MQSSTVKALMLAGGSFFAVFSAAYAQQNPAPLPQIDFSKAEIEVLPVRGNVYLMVGEGGNTSVQIGNDGVLLVDTQFAEMSDKMLTAIRKLSDKPLRYIINTHAHPDHVGGNENLRKAGSTIAGVNVQMDISDAQRGAQIIAHQNVLNRMSAPTGQRAPTPPGGWPTDTFFGDSKKFRFNGEAIEVIHLPNAHTDGDSIVFFRSSDVISTGDIFLTTNYPFIDTARGGTIQGEIDALNRILDLIVPVYGQEGGTMVVPGHGRLCDLGDIVDYREMVTIIRDRIQDMVKKGMTLEQVKVAKPTRDYDPVFGSTTGFWTTDMFVEAVYKGLAQRQ